MESYTLPSRDELAEDGRRMAVGADITPMAPPDVATGPVLVSYNAEAYGCMLGSLMRVPADP